MWRSKLQHLAGDGGVAILGDVLSQRAIKALAKRAALLAAR